MVKATERESREGHHQTPIEKALQRVAEYTDVSLRSVKEIKKEGINAEASESCFLTPDKNRNREKTVVDVDTFDSGVIRITVHNFYKTHSRVPTVDALRQELSKSIGFKEGNTSLRKILKELGFKWRSTKSKRSVLIESLDIRLKRITVII